MQEFHEKGAKMDEGKRAELLQKLEEEQIELGPNARALVVRSCFGGKSVQDFMHMVTPYTHDGPGEWSLQAPQIASAGLPDLLLAAFVLKTVIHEKLCPLIVEQPPCAEKIVEYCGHMQGMVARAPASVGAAVHAALQDISEIAEFFLSVHATDLTSPKASEAASSVRSSRHGAKGLVKHAVSQSPFWSGLEKKAREVQVALTALGPEMDSMVKKLEEGQEGSMTEALARISEWKDTLGSQAVLKLQQMVKDQVSQRWLDLRNAGDGEVQKFVHEFDKVVAKPDWLEQALKEAKLAIRETQRKVQRKLVMDVLKPYLAKDSC